MGVKPWLWLTPQFAHKISPTILKSFNYLPTARALEWAPWTWRGLYFPNRLGLAGGVDKNAENMAAWWNLGAGFLEVGTITPMPQKGNTPPVVDRDVAHEALWNRLGFPSHGVDKVQKRLAKVGSRALTPIFANIGKNASTPLEAAHQDYIELLRRLRDFVDGFVINISSPNTRGLRELLKPERLKEFLSPIMASLPSAHKPVLLKLSPDMEDSELRDVLGISYDLGVDGWVLTNTSQGLRDDLKFPKEGGVSGRPLANRSKEVLRRSLDILGPRREGRLIVSVGGVMSAADVAERLQMGADLVQVYSALIFQGPFFMRKVAKCQRANPVA